MPLTRAQAKEICTQPEYELVESSFRPAVTELTPARLRSKIERARRLQDKYRDLARRQHRGTKETARSRETSNVRTERKARLFEQTRERFEKRLAQLEARAAADAAGSGAGQEHTPRTPSRRATAARRKERRQAKQALR